VDVAAPGVDRGLLSAWVAGWAMSRGAPAPVPAYGGFLVQVGLPEHKARYVFPAVGNGVRKASLAIREPYVFLKVCAEPDDVTAILADGWSLRPPGFLMTTDRLQANGRALSSPYSLQRERVNGGGVVRILTAEGGVAASGRLFVAGGAAIFDQIVTHADHRRRGLATAVMTELTALASGLGAKGGVLVATSEGRELYATLGWRVLSPYTTAARD
jgi:GNAT superfamily N-acetyltransferase